MLLHRPVQLVVAHRRLLLGSLRHSSPLKAPPYCQRRHYGRCDSSTVERLQPRHGERAQRDAASHLADGAQVRLEPRRQRIVGEVLRVEDLQRKHRAHRHLLKDGTNQSYNAMEPEGRQGVLRGPQRACTY